MLNRDHLIEHLDALLGRDRGSAIVASVSLDRGLDATAEVARRLDAIAGPEEVVGRTDTASFALVARDPRPAARGVVLVAHIHAALRAPCRVEGRMVVVSARTGLALARKPDADASAMLARADDAAGRRQLRAAG